MAVHKHRRVGAIAFSRLVGKNRVTVPPCVRKKLHLKPGDNVVFEEAEAGTIRLRKVEPLDLEFLSGLESPLSEWNSENDDQAYRDL